VTVINASPTANARDTEAAIRSGDCSTEGALAAIANPANAQVRPIQQYGIGKNFRATTVTPIEIGKPVIIVRIIRNPSQKFRLSLE
jgi:hypothetical protein